MQIWIPFYLTLEAGAKLSETEKIEDILEVGELHELQTFVGSKENKIWVWKSVNHLAKGILVWAIVDWLSILDALSIASLL